MFALMSSLTSRTNKVSQLMQKLDFIVPVAKISNVGNYNYSQSYQVKRR